METKILIAEDEEKIRHIVASYLVREGYRVIEAGDGQELIDKFSQHEDASLIILDVMMPRKNGFEVCREVRQHSDVPVLMLTARDTENDEVTGFNCGADEYIAKPFSPKILVTRVKNLLRRTASGDLSDITLGELCIHYRERAAFIGTTQLTLTPREFDLLYYLAKNKNIVLSRDQILSGVWDIDYVGDDRTVDTHIKCLRTKLGSFGARIITLRKVGYKFEWNNETEHSPQG